MQTSTSLNGESVVLASASSKGSKRIWSELGAFEMTFFILSINIASVGTVLYTYLLIEGENEGKKKRPGVLRRKYGVAWQNRDETFPIAQGCRKVVALYFLDYLPQSSNSGTVTTEPAPIV